MDAAGTSPLILYVFNGGSSSIKFSVYTTDGSLTLIYDGEASGIGTSEAGFTFYAVHGERHHALAASAAAEELRSFGDAVRKIAATLDRPDVPRPTAIGHRVVHTGPKLDAHQRITPDVFAAIQKAIPFAPLHEPLEIEIIRETMRHFPGVAQFACFDTVFHQSMPDVASTYPLPRELRERGLHRYGFHGLACESIVRQFQAGRVPGHSPAAGVPARLLVAHLGSGASVTAVCDGRSIDTTMGLTPCGGIIMGTRSGDLDPGLIFFLLRDQAANPIDAVEELLNKRSGMLALSDLSGDMRVLRAAASHGNAQASLAIESFVRSVKKAIGGFVALLEGVDALVFSGGIGEHDARTRFDICAGLETFGITIDSQRNEALLQRSALISREETRTAVYVLPAEEDRMIATHVTRLFYET